MAGVEDLWGLKYFFFEWIIARTRDPTTLFRTSPNIGQNVTVCPSFLSLSSFVHHRAGPNAGKCL
jgi:hypothetical protein